MHLATVHSSSQQGCKCLACHGVLIQPNSCSEARNSTPWSLHQLCSGCALAAPQAAMLVSLALHGVSYWYVGTVLSETQASATAARYHCDTIFFTCLVPALDPVRALHSQDTARIHFAWVPLMQRMMHERESESAVRLCSQRPLQVPATWLHAVLCMLRPVFADTCVFAHHRQGRLRLLSRAGAAQGLGALRSRTGIARERNVRFCHCGLQTKTGAPLQAHV